MKSWILYDAVRTADYRRLLGSPIDSGTGAHSLVAGYWAGMSRENVEVVRALAESFQRRDHELAFDPGRSGPLP
jgi:hypothetical protein